MSMQPRPATCRPPVSASVPDRMRVFIITGYLKRMTARRVIWINALEEEEPRRLKCPLGGKRGLPPREMTPALRLPWLERAFRRRPGELKWFSRGSPVRPRRTSGSCRRPAAACGGYARTIALCLHLPRVGRGQSTVWYCLLAGAEVLDHLLDEGAGHLLADRRWSLAKKMKASASMLLMSHMVGLSVSRPPCICSIDPIKKINQPSASLERNLVSLAASASRYNSDASWLSRSSLAQSSAMVMWCLRQ